ncbi:MAG TPA: nuclear transport factor 2 family protein [Gemmatimonadales bacterium]|nr:nuclear transport factor 2 family protein [Gemmatimonadales bacterium]
MTTVWRAIPIVLLAGCSRPAEPAFDQAARAAVVDSVQATLDEFRAAVASMDAERVASFYVADSTLRWIEDGEIRYRSRDEVIEALRSMEGEVGAISLSYDGTQITALAPGIASVVTGFAQRITRRDGEEGGFAGATTMVLRSEGGRWRFVNGHVSSR